MAFTSDPCDRCGAAVLLGVGTITPVDRDGHCHFVCAACAPVAGRALRVGYCVRADIDDVLDAEAYAAHREA